MGKGRDFLSHSERTLSRMNRLVVPFGVGDFNRTVAPCRALLQSTP
jgi:hypothetical protein